MRKLRFEMISQGTLNHISIEPLFMTVSSWHNNMMRVLRSSSRNYLKARRSTDVFIRIIREFYGLKVALSFRKITNSESKFLMKHIFPNSLFIQVVAKCIRTLNQTSGGPG
jgi:hypothetical protein